MKVPGRLVLVVFMLAVAPWGGASLAWAQQSGFPYAATVTSPAVHLRAGHGTEFQVLSELHQGDALQVIGRHGEWLQVEIPAGVKLYVSERYIDAAGVVQVSRLNVRPKPSTQFENLGQVGKGTQLTIISKADGWVAVAPPQGFYAWINARLVDNGSALTANLPERTVSTPRPGTASAGAVATHSTISVPGDNGGTVPAAVSRSSDAFQQAFDRALELYTAELTKGLADADLGQVASLLQHVVDDAQDNSVRESARAALSRCQRAMQLQKEYRDAQRNVERVMATSNAARAAVELPASQNIGGSGAVTAPRVDESSFAAVGYVDGLGKFFGRQGTHVLVKGGQNTTYLMTDPTTQLNLNRYVGKRVGVRGVSAGTAIGDQRIIQVTEVVVLSDS